MVLNQNAMPADPEDTKPTQPAMGRPVGEHEFRSDLRRMYLIAAGSSLLAGAISLVLGFWRYQVALQRYGPALVRRWSLPFFTSALALFGLALIAYILYLRKRTIKVATFRHGLIYQRGTEQTSVLWRDIRHVYTTAFNYGVFGIAWRGRKELLLLHSHSKLRLTSLLSDWEDLADTIKEHVYPELLPMYTEAFQHGRALVFGPIRVTSEGIQKGRRLLRWEKLGDVRILRGKLQLLPDEETGGKRILVATHVVPNVELCAQVIERLGRRR